MWLTDCVGWEGRRKCRKGGGNGIGLKDEGRGTEDRGEERKRKAAGERQRERGGD